MTKHEQERTAEVIPINRHGAVETINGARVNLSRLSIDELYTLALDCWQRMEDAKLEMAIVDAHIEGRQGGGDVA